MPRVIHFEIHAEDPERAAKFYRELFDWEITRWEGPSPYWLVTTGPDGQPGINGGILKRTGSPPSPGQPVNAYIGTVDVPDLDGFLVRSGNLGSKVVVARMAVAGIGWLAYCTDTEGNIFGMMQSDPTAA
jgi:predicted enzyme related to lactoylglutathione lyase